MRGAIHFVVIVVISVLLVIGAAVLAGVSPVVAGVGFAVGVAVAIAGSIVVNTRNAHRYGRKVWEDLEHSDFTEKAPTYAQPESPWGECQRAGYHSADMRLDRVRRHPEAPATFPAGDVA